MPRAKELSETLALPLCMDDDAAESYDFLLTVTPTQLQLRQTGSQAPGPLVIDFLSGPLRQRLLKNAGRRELIARAVGWKQQEKLTVLDATAGLGRDGFLLATLGFAVIMLERSPIIAALLRDGLQRALADPAFKHLAIELQVIDAIDYLRLLEPRHYPDIIYLDPMFPQRTKSARVKKEMQYLQALLGSDTDIDTLFALALRRAKKRVVLKRPKAASVFSAVKPDIQFIGKDSRFDVYLR